MYVTSQLDALHHAREPNINPVFTLIIKLIGTLRKNTDDIDELEDSQDTDQKDSAAGARVCTSIGMSSSFGRHTS